MGASPIHEALASLAPIDISEIPSDDKGLTQFLSETFKDATTLIDSVPLQDASETSSSSRSRGSSTASCSSEVVLSDARPEPPSSDIEKLQKAWGKPVRLKANENPLGMSVYKLAGNDGKGAWFARRSIHEGLPYLKWKKALQSEFAETLKTQGGPGEGNIRGIGGEKRVECREAGEAGKLEVWDLTAQFPGPTTPREFVEAVCTSDTKTSDGRSQFIVVSKPCKHPDAPERDGMIRGQYQSVEIIREVPTAGRPKSSGGRKRAQSSALGRQAAIRNSEQSDASPEGRKRAKTVGQGTPDANEGAEDEKADGNPVEWIMLTRSDPGGSVPRFMVERGTPGSIVADAAKFLDWACAVDEDELDDAKAAVEPPGAAGVAAGAAEAAETPSQKPLKHEKKHKEKRPSLTAQETNGHLAGLQGRDEGYVPPVEEPQQAAGGGIFSTITGAVGGAANIITSRLPAIPIPGYSGGSAALPHADERQRRYSTSSSSSSNSDGSFTSARDRYARDSDSDGDTTHRHPLQKADTRGTDTTTGTEPFPALSGQSNVDPARPASSGSKNIKQVDEKEEKERSKFERRKTRLSEKLTEQLVKIRQREASHGSQESAESNEKVKEEEKRNENIRKAEEKYEREVRHQEEKFRREMAKLREKREREERKEIERQFKEKGKSEMQQLKMLLERERHECQVLKVERDLLRKQVGELQRENTRLAVGVGKLPGGEALLNEVRLKREGDKEGVLIDGTKREQVMKENIAMRT